MTRRDGNGAALNGAHASRITVCGREWRVRRELELALRIEERFGALGPVVDRLRSFDVSIAGLAALLAEILRDQSDPPGESEIRAWIFEHGVPAAATPCVKVIAPLFTGAETGRTDDDDDDAARGEPITDPRAASSDGPG